MPDCKSAVVAQRRQATGHGTAVLIHWDNYCKITQNSPTIVFVAQNVYTHLVSDLYDIPFLLDKKTMVLVSWIGV